MGHRISQHGVRKDHEKTSKVTEWPVPECVKDVRRLRGFTSYFRKYIKNYAVIVSPLSSLLQGYSNKPSNRRQNKIKELDMWKWTNECQLVFEKLKTVLVEDVTLAFADFEKEFFLEVDACKTGIGAVLYQLDDNQKRRPLAYASRKTSRTEQAYSTHKLEFLGLKWAVFEKFREYLYNGHKCQVFTDNNPLKFLLDKSKIDATLQRWCAELANFNITVSYKSGITNIAADALSRVHEDHNQLDDADGIHMWCREISKPMSTITSSIMKEILLDGSTESMPMMDAMMISDLEMKQDVPIPYRIASVQSLRKNKDWHAIQKEDMNISMVKEMVKSGKVISTKQLRTLSPRTRAILRRRNHLYVNGDILMLKNKDGTGRIVVSNNELPLLMKCYHEAQCHMGEDRTLDLIQSRFFWPGMKHSIINYIKQCNRCTLRKSLPANNNAGMGHLAVAKHPFDIVAMDHVSIDHRSTGTQKVLTVVDQFTKYAFFIHVSNEKAATTAKKLMDEIFTKFGFPNHIHSDNGSAFINSIMRELTTMCKMKHTQSLPYTPQGNAMCERLNRTLLDMLGTMEEEMENESHLYSMLITPQYMLLHGILRFTSCLEDTLGWLEILFWI